MRKRVVYYDVLNIMAIIAVMALHCNGIVHSYSTNNIKAWSTSLIVECVFFWAVPIFLMLTGANLLKYREKYDTKTFFKKRILKVLIPFIFWAIVMTIWKYNIGVLKINDFSLKSFLNIFFANKEEATYYFMFIILGIYLTMPLLSILSEDKYRKTCWYVVAALFVTQTTLPIALKLFEISYNTSLAIQLGGYIIYPLLGYLLSTQELNKKQRWVIYTFGILSILFRYGMTYYWTTTSNILNKTLFSYTQFHSVLLACAVFVLIKKCKFAKIENNEKLSKIIANISACSFGIYLIHKIIMYYEIQVLSININSWKWRTIGVLSTYIISLGIVYILKKIPIIKKIVP